MERMSSNTHVCVSQPILKPAQFLSSNKTLLPVQCTCGNSILYSSNLSAITGLEIMASHRTMSTSAGDLTGQTSVLPVMLTGFREGEGVKIVY